MGKRLTRLDYLTLITVACFLVCALQLLGKLFLAWVSACVPDHIVSITEFVHMISYIAFGLVEYKYALCYLYRKSTKRSLYKDRLEYKRSFTALKQFYETADPYHLNEGELPAERWRDAEGVILGKVGGRLIKRPSFGVGNLAVFSLPGGGKTTSQIIPSAMRFNGSVLAVDIKGDILNFAQNHSERMIQVFDPENPETSAHYNPFEGIEELSELERKTMIEQIAYVLMPDTGEKDGKYFLDGGRDYFCGIALYMLHCDFESTLSKISRAIVEGNAFDWTKTILDSSCDLAKSYIASYYGSNEKNVAGAYGTVAKAVRPFAYGALSVLLEPGQNELSPESLEIGLDVYIEIPQDKIKLYAPVTTIIVQQFLMAFMRRTDISSGKELRPILFLLDEFPQLQFDYDTLMAALSTLRSKRVSLFLAFQSIAQANHRYGDAGFRAIMDTCAYISIMSAQDPDSREYFSRLCGTHKYLKVTTSYDGNKQKTRTISEEQEPVFRPADFGNLGDDVVIVANGKYIRAQKTYCFKN